jgi:drug/metabolite transporter (DMT)-like permease
LPTTSSHHHRPVVGVLLKLTSVLFLASLAACVKYLGTAIPSGEMVFARGVISMAVIALIAWRTDGLGLLRTRNWGSHALRSLSGTVSMFCWFIALTLLPLADMTAITFTAPMFLTLLAMLFLGERIHAFRTAALAIGFVGVLIMIGPHLSLTASSSVGVLVALAAAVFSALAMMFLRSMSGAGGEHALTITFYFSVTMTVCGALTAVAGWPMPTPTQWLVIVLAGLFGAVGQLLMTLSYRYAEASTIAPLDYTSLLAAISFGYWLFDETPAASVWIGAPLVVAAGLIILWREYRRSLTIAPPAVPPPA